MSAHVLFPLVVEVAPASSDLLYCWFEDIIVGMIRCLITLF